MSSEHFWELVRALLLVEAAVLLGLAYACTRNIRFFGQYTAVRTAAWCLVGIYFVAIDSILIDGHAWHHGRAQPHLWWPIPMRIVILTAFAGWLILRIRLVRRNPAL